MNEVRKPLFRGSLLFLGLMVAAFAAIYKAMDNYTVHNYITADDGLTAAFSYLIVGGWIGTIMNVIYSFFFGRRLIDENFTHIRWNNKYMQQQALIAGSISSVSTLFVLWGHQFGDPGALISLSSAVLIYTAIYDVWKENIQLKLMGPPILAAVGGGAMAAFSGSVAITLVGVLFVLIISNSLSAFSEVIEQNGVKKSDSVSFHAWRFFWLSSTGTVLAIVVSALRGYSDLLYETVTEAVVYLPFVGFTMFFVFLSSTLRLVLKKKYAISAVLLVTSAKVLFAFPITFIGDWAEPGMFGKLPSEPWIWGIRFLGATLLIWGITRIHYIEKKAKLNTPE